MTREEVIDKYMEARNHGVELDTISVINILYDDIESRVCENCIHSSIDYSGTQHQCILLRMSFNSDFGCNYFKSKVESK